MLGSWRIKNSLEVGVISCQLNLFDPTDWLLLTYDAVTYSGHVIFYV